MADHKEEKKADAPAKDEHGKEAKAKGGGLMTKTPVLIGVSMILEAAVLFAGFKFLIGGPKAAEAATITTEEGDAAETADPHADPHAKADDHAKPAAEAHGKADEHGKTDAPVGPPKKIAELDLVEFKAQNKRSGRTYLYDVKVCVIVKGKLEDKVKSAIADRKALIQDRARTIVAQSDPDKLSGGSEPGLETFRRQIKYQLDEIVGPGLIDEVLVPRCTAMRLDF